MHMMKSEPSHELLEKVVTIAEAKLRLPLHERNGLNQWGVFCNRKHRLFGTLLYVAGGQFNTKLDFIRKRDGSIHVNKYIPGDWELALENTYNYAKYIIESRIDEREKVEYLQSSAKAKNQEEKQYLLEQRASVNPAWLWYLFLAYCTAGRFKDAELTLIKFVEKWPIFYTHNIAGNVYLNALARSTGVKLPPQLAIEEWGNWSLQDLGYTYDYTLGLARRHIQESQRLLPQKNPEMQSILHAALTELSALEKQHS